MTQKELELLTKLVRLANNNSNEHEANLAARRACKLIEQCNFNFNTSLHNVKTINEPSIPYNDPWNTDNWIFDYMRKYAEQSQREQERNKQYREGGWDFSSRKQREKTEKRVLRCKTCNKDKQTIFLGLPELFECNDCQWTAFHRKQQGQTK